ncbi:MAG: hypothetical protein WCT02_01320 [Candidatus Paceibacterota bacterium]
MPDPTSGAERVAGTARKEFSVDAALDNKDFLTFLAGHPDAETFDMADEKAIENRFQTFEAKTQVSAGLKELYGGKIEKDLGFKLDAAGFEAIAKHVEKEAIENPEEVVALRSRLELFKTLPGQISTLESQLAQLGQREDLAEKLEVLREDKENLDTAKDFVGRGGTVKLATYQAIAFASKALPFLSEVLGTSNSISADKWRREIAKKSEKISEQWEVLGKVKDKHGDIGKEQAVELSADLQTQIWQVENALSSLTRLEDLKAAAEKLFGEIRENVLGGIEEIAGLTNAIQSQVDSQLKALMAKGTLKDFDKAKTRFEALQGVEDAGELGIKPLGAIDKAKFEKEVNAAIEKSVREQVMETVMNTKLGTNAFSRLEKSLAGFLDRTKVGSKEGNEAREFLTTALEEASETLPDDGDCQSKRIMISRIIIKLKLKP